MTEQRIQTTDRRPPEGGRVALTARATYRQLIVRGLAPGEAANVTAYLNGLAPTKEPWTIDEITKILFLRELDRLGCFSYGS